MSPKAHIDAEQTAQKAAAHGENRCS